MIQQLCTAIFDGIAMVQKTRGDQKTLAEVGDSLMYFVLNKGTDSKRIDVIFDVYKDNSIKSSKREKSGSENGHEFRNIKGDHKIHQWRKFLSNSKNKSLLIKFIAEEWQNERHRERLAGKTIFATTEDYCYKVPSIGMTTRKEVGSTQEEADTSVSPYNIFNSRRIQSCSYYVREYRCIFSLFGFKGFISCPMFAKRS